MITKAQASRMRRGYELWHIFRRNKDGAPARCFVQAYSHFTKRKPGAFVLTVKKVSARNKSEIFHITNENDVWVRPCDWHSAIANFALDNNGEWYWFRLGKREKKLMRRGAR